nr:hypothetical protein [uncultured Psychroserpens sp.]
MESYEYLYAASTVIYIITSIIVVIASILLHNKVKSSATILVLIGSISAFIFNLGDIFLSLIAGRYDVETYIQINAIANIVSGIAYGMFCVGLLLFVVNDLKKGES